MVVVPVQFGMEQEELVLYGSVVQTLVAWLLIPGLSGSEPLKLQMRVRWSIVFRPRRHLDLERFLG